MVHRIPEGTTEGTNPMCADDACTATRTWVSYVNDTVKAFYNAGGTHVQFFTLAGGQHDATAWTTTFEAGVTQMYSVNFTAKYQMQYAATSAVKVVFSSNGGSAGNCPAAQPSGGGGGGGSGGTCSSNTVLVALVLVVVLETVAIAIYWFMRSSGGANDARYNALSTLETNN